MWGTNAFVFSIPFVYAPENYPNVLQVAGVAAERAGFSGGADVVTHYEAVETAASLDEEDDWAPQYHWRIRALA
jgi:hypothetical protein